MAGRITKNELHQSLKNEIESKASQLDLETLAENQDQTATQLVQIEEEIKFKGCLLRKTLAQSISNATATVVNWNLAEHDTNAFWSSGNPSIITIPSGVRKVRLQASLGFSSVNDDTPRQLSFRKNGTGAFLGNGQVYYRNINAFGYRLSRAVVSTAILEVNEGDTFQLVTQQDSGGSLDIGADSFVWFALEVIE